MLANDPAAADPVCRFSPHHAKVEQAVADAEAGLRRVREQPLVFRDATNSRRLTREQGLLGLQAE
jgi:pyrroloquinoline quinone biosynthesis protein E